ncbi:fructose-specific phosphotransferase system IIA component [Enterococcus ureilyticus]|nr:fructose PTS transporter subunit IIA [Enterococcus ureilyticus]MBM7689076.1 fructose-specific phosphotransferase system IIA component [Enterococcus ureilyticus]
MNNRASDVIKKDMILLQTKFQMKDEVLHALVQKAGEAGLISDETLFLNAVLNREAEVPTAIGYQIAIPHGKSEVVKTPFIGFLQTEEEFIWTKGHEEQVKLVFLIGIPAENENNIHLKFISQLSKKLLDEEFRNQLIEEKNQEKVFKLLRSINVVS